MAIKFTDLKKQFTKELEENILNFWLAEVYDPQRKTFFGRINNGMTKFADAPLSAVFITRILWAFSASYRILPKTEYKKIADEAFQTIVDIFWDQTNAGIYWSVFPDGEVEDSKKQFYAQAFFIYALSEYYLAFKSSKAKQLAISMYLIFENYGFDKELGGYFEAKTADWRVPNDQRLSEKDMDVEKSMNTHLHILEAYTNLYRIYRDPHLKEKLEKLLFLFLETIIDKKSKHLILFFDANWKVRSSIDSYGHDIEASWLLCEAAEVLDNKTLLLQFQSLAVKMANLTEKEGIASHGGLFYEKQENQLLNEFHWWPQAEAVVGFFNAYQISGKKKYLELMVNSWNFIKTYIIDHKSGEWFWGVNSELMLLEEDKTGPWKAPYHNGRMCIEMIRRIEEIECNTEIL